MNNGLLDPAIVSFVFTPLVVTSAILFALWWKRMQSSRAVLDAPGLLLASAVPAMPAARREWGVARQPFHTIFSLEQPRRRH
jgi:hypothetical protein